MDIPVNTDVAILQMVAVKPDKTFRVGVENIIGENCDSQTVQDSIAKAGELLNPFAESGELFTWIITCIDVIGKGILH